MYTSEFIRMLANFKMKKKGIIIVISMYIIGLILSIYIQSQFGSNQSNFIGNSFSHKLLFAYHFIVAGTLSQIIFDGKIENKNVFKLSTYFNVVALFSAIGLFVMTSVITRCLI